MYNEALKTICSTSILVIEIKIIKHLIIMNWQNVSNYRKWKHANASWSSGYFEFPLNMIALYYNVLGFTFGSKTF